MCRSLALARCASNAAGAAAASAGGVAGAELLVEEEELEELGGLQEMRLGGHGPYGLYAGGVAQPTVPAKVQEMYERLKADGYNSGLADDDDDNDGF